MGSIMDMGNNKYRFRASTGSYENRKYISETVQASSMREAKKLYAKFISRIESGNTYSASKTTLNEFSKKWLGTYVKPNLSPTTYQSYTEKLNMHILPYLGHKRLDKITPFDIDSLYNLLANKLTNRKDENGNYKTLSPASIHRIHEIISSMFSSAYKWDLVPYNPCNKVTKPKYKSTKMTCYDEETLKRLINKLLEIAPLKHKCFILLAILGGFRRGEIVGLHWDDIDFKNKKITINRSVYYLGGEGVNEKSTKTDSSNRTIAISGICFDLLKQWRAEQGKIRLALGDKWNGSKNIFTTDDGRIMNPTTVPKWFSEFLKKHGFPHIRFHDLRHTFATLLISYNVDVKTVSHKLGHASTTTTMNFYVHNLESTDKASAELLEDKLFSNVNTV